MWIIALLCSLMTHRNKHLICLENLSDSQKKSSFLLPQYHNNKKINISQCISVLAQYWRAIEVGLEGF